MKSRILSAAVSLFLSVSACCQHYALYDMAADQFIPYEFRSLERRNISPDCEERTTAYPEFKASSKYPQISSVNARIRRMYTYYMSDTFVDELQRNYRKVVINYRENFPAQLNCVNEQKVYAVNFTTMEVSLVSCHLGVVTVMNSLFYTVANAPITQIQTNVYSEVLQINLNTGTLLRSPSLIRQDKQSAFTELVRRQLDIYLEQYRNNGGVINSNPEFTEPEVDEYGYPIEQQQLNEETSYDGGSEDVMDAPAFVTVPDEYVLASIYTTPEETTVRNRRTGVDSAVQLIRYSDLIVYWKNFSLFVRVSPYADMAAYIPNGLIEVDFSWKEVNAYLINSPEALFKNAPDLNENELTELLKQPAINKQVPFFNNDPQNVSGIKKMKINEEHYSLSKDLPYSKRYRLLIYDDSGRIKEILNYEGQQDTSPSSKTSYVYKAGTLNEIIYYDQGGNVQSITPATGLTISEKTKGYFYLRDNGNLIGSYDGIFSLEYKVYVLPGRIIIEPQFQIYISDEDYGGNGDYNNNYARIIHFNGDKKKLGDFSLHYQASVAAEVTKEAILPVIARHHYNPAGQLLNSHEYMADYNDAGQLIYINFVNSNEFEGYSYDAAGRVIQIIKRSNEVVQHITRFTYAGTSVYPATAEYIEPAYSRTVKYLFEVQ